MLKDDVKEIAEEYFKAGVIEMLNYSINMHTHGEILSPSDLIDKLWNQSEAKQDLETKLCKECGEEIKEVTTLELCSHCLYGEDV